MDCRLSAETDSVVAACVAATTLIISAMTVRLIRKKASNRLIILSLGLVQLGQHNIQLVDQRFGFVQQLSGRRNGNTGRAVEVVLVVIKTA